MRGEAFLQYFLQSLSYEEYNQIKVSEGKNIFKLGNNKMIKRLRKIQFPVNIAGVVCCNIQYTIGTYSRSDEKSRYKSGFSTG